MGASTYNLTYDAENRLTAVSGAATASFVYDGDGNRVKGTVGGVTTTYIGNYFEWTGNTSTMKRYYYAGGVRVAMRTGTADPKWLLGDHLGSQAYTVSYAGTSEEGEVRYKPWGEDRYTSGTTPTTFKYTGQRSEAALGIYFYGARYYDPSLGRFLQADSLVPNPNNPQDWDRFSYVRNNPLKYTDPTGHAALKYLFDGDPINGYTTFAAEIRSVNIFDEDGKLVPPGTNFSQGKINGMTGLCGAVSTAAVVATRDRSLDANTVVQQMMDAGINPNYPSYYQLEAMIEEFDGWEATFGAAASEDTGIDTLEAALKNGQYPITRGYIDGGTGNLWSDPEAAEHWWVVTGVSNYGTVSIFNPYDNVVQHVKQTDFIMNWFLPHKDEEISQALFVFATPPQEQERYGGRQ